MSGAALTAMSRPLVGLLTALVCVLGLVRLWSGLGAEALFEGERRAQERLADRLARQAVTHGSGPVYQSGVRRFDGQSQIAIDQMRHVFNCGVGLLVVVDAAQAETALAAMGDTSWRIGDIVPRGDGEAVVYR